jgi:hypothetical protein
MKRIILSFFTLTLLMIPATVEVKSQPPAQSNCILTTANSPAVRDLRLGMSLQQLLAMFPASNKRKEIREALEKAKETTGNEIVYLPFEPATDGSSERFSGIDSVLIGIHKGQVVDFNVSYVGPTWKTVEDWIEKLSQTFGLPKAKAWVTGPNENPSKVLQCKGVEVEAGIQGGGASIRVRNTEYRKETEERKEGEEERKRRVFKP